jgi:pimeloyl-ACP methyl ester carboxylesterase
MLARAGYGVLLYDARGRGKSDGDTDAYGWTWGRDVDAAIAWLKRRPGVDDFRIGALGLSTGADVLVEVAARRHDLRAVVADGSTNRSLADVAEVAHGGDWLALPFYASLYGASEVFLGARPGPPLADLAAQVPPTPIFFIASNWAVERQAAPVYAEAAAASSRLWEVDAGHTEGLEQHPREYAHRVLAFFDQGLLHDE